MLNCPWKPQGFISPGKEKEKCSMGLNWFCRPCEIQQWFWRFENPQSPQESLSPTQDTKLTKMHFIQCYPHLVQFFFLWIFPEDWGGGFWCQKLDFVLATHAEISVCVWYLCHFFVTYVCMSHSQNWKSQAVGRRRNSRPKPSAFEWKRWLMKLQMVSFLFFWRKG